ncbi:hypothetical protein [Limnobacter parvus]|uniref:Uncharacterized protein n=1 Tax=Limnobacter parvus TaxID=2939690 RepID=A0ABT1XL01_9BURK|nr:hypothetical protein [Limnobacter parvus]MCR2747541.1 hypothetical protein [Limnobacter parvus]
MGLSEVRTVLIRGSQRLTHSALIKSNSPSLFLAQGMRNAKASSHRPCGRPSLRIKLGDSIVNRQNDLLLLTLGASTRG